MNNKRKVRRLGILAFAPLALFLVWVVVYLVMLRDYIAQYRMEQHEDIVTTTAYYYDPLFVLMAVTAIVGLAALLYFIMNVANRQNMPTGQKMVWVVFLASLNIFAFPVYWYMHIKNEHVVRDNPSPALS